MKSMVRRLITSHQCLSIGQKINYPPVLINARPTSVRPPPAPRRPGRWSDQSSSHRYSGGCWTPQLGYHVLLILNSGLYGGWKSEFSGQPSQEVHVDTFKSLLAASPSPSWRIPLSAAAPWRCCRVGSKEKMESLFSLYKTSMPFARFPGRLNELYFSSSWRAWGSVSFASSDCVVTCFFFPLPNLVLGSRGVCHYIIHFHFEKC